jgi:dUTP pyrophosphatase
MSPIIPYVGTMPTKNYPADAGSDLYASRDSIIPARDSAIIGTGTKTAIPLGYVGLIWSRSGLSCKHKIETGAGCIDYGYTGELQVHLHNHSEVPYQIHKGDKIAQLLVMPILLPTFEPVDELPEADRGINGFGSTGK